MDVILSQVKFVLAETSLERIEIDCARIVVVVLGEMAAKVDERKDTACAESGFQFVN